MDVDLYRSFSLKMVKLNMEDPWIAMYQGVDEVEQAVHRYHRMEEEEQQDPQEREQLASIFGGVDYKPESGSNYHREPPKDGRPYSTLCNVCPTYVYNDEEKGEPKIKKEDRRDWHEEPPKNGEPYTVLETDPPLYEYKEIANPVGGGGEPVQQTLDVPLLEIPAVELLPAKKRKQTVAAKKRNHGRKQVKKKAKKEKEVDQPDAALQQQQQIPVVEQEVAVAPSVPVQNEPQPLQQQQQPYTLPVSYYYPPWQPPFPISYWQPVTYYPPMPPYYTAAAAAAELPSQAR